jgi:hypothetical protein
MTWHATILHLLDLDHTRLTFNYGGRDFRLTDIYGEVVTMAVWHRLPFRLPVPRQQLEA